jgi:membrane-bound metal-dependent hydrolase YbcI (DUF457 family)
MLQFWVLNVPIEPDIGYNKLGLFGYFLMTFRESIGDLGNIDGSGFSGVLLWYYSVVWFIFIFIMMIIYTNFIIAVVCDTFARVTAEKEVSYRKKQHEYLKELSMLKLYNSRDIHPLVVKGEKLDEG